MQKWLGGSANGDQERSFFSTGTAMVKWAQILVVRF